MTIDGSGFRAHDSLYFGLDKVPAIQGPPYLNVYDGPWHKTADSGGKFALKIRYAECDQSADISGLKLRIFATDTTNQTITSVTVLVSKFCGSNSEVPAAFSLES